MVRHKDIGPEREVVFISCVSDRFDQPLGIRPIQEKLVIVVATESQFMGVSGDIPTLTLLRDSIICPHSNTLNDFSGHGKTNQDTKSSVIPSHIGWHPFSAQPKGMAEPRAFPSLQPAAGRDATHQKATGDADGATCTLTASSYPF